MVESHQSSVSAAFGGAAVIMGNQSLCFMAQRIKRTLCFRLGWGRFRIKSLGSTKVVALEEV